MKIVIADIPKGWQGRYPWKHGEALLLLGEVENAPGHVAVATKSGRVYWLFDKDSFREANEDEI